MKDARGGVVYVGKAKQLRSRVRQYFRPDGDTRYQVNALLRQVETIDTIVTATEKEALLLEHTLIRKHKPRYNILFRDDKSYASIKVTFHHPYPGIFRTRKILKDGAQYFGPYTSGQACRETVDAVTQFFRLRTCSDREFANRARPCVQYQIGRCTAPCVGLISAEAYRANIEQALHLLMGRRNELTAALTAQMQAHAAAEQYEDAARVRDLLRGIAETIERQHMVRHGAADCDYVGWAAADGRGAVCVLHVHDGKVVGQHAAVVELLAEPYELIASYLEQLYRAPRDLPKRVMLSDIVGVRPQQYPTNVRMHIPQRGVHAQLTALACTNAAQVLVQRTGESIAWEALSESLAQALQLSQPPRVIECMDVSNWQGTLAGAALVCFEAGERNTERYRHYNIRGPNEPNDYLMMREAVSRRLTGDNAPPLPDVLLIDGGRGHLQTAERVLHELGITNVPLASIAKPREGEATDKIYLPGRKNPLPLRKGDPVLLYLQRIRDEAHRFAITHQRARRRKKIVGSK